MPTNRCTYNRVWDYTTRRYRTCKNRKTDLELDDSYCPLHYKIIYEENAILIQKIYKGYYIRKKLKIYYKLPRDLQRKIVWHINSDLYLKHYSSSVSKIIYNRYKTFFRNTTLKNILVSVISDSKNILYINSNDFSNFFIEYDSLLKLTIKYHYILNSSKILNLGDIIEFNMTLLFYEPNYRFHNKDLIMKYNSLFVYSNITHSHQQRWKFGSLAPGFN
jgi:hypothetical protein